MAGEFGGIDGVGEGERGGDLFAGREPGVLVELGVRDAAPEMVRAGFEVVVGEPDAGPERGGIDGDAAGLLGGPGFGGSEHEEPVAGPAPPPGVGRLQADQPRRQGRPDQGERGGGGVETDAEFAVDRFVAQRGDIRGADRGRDQVRRGREFAVRVGVPSAERGEHGGEQQEGGAAMGAHGGCQRGQPPGRLPGDLSQRNGGRAPQERPRARGVPGEESFHAPGTRRESAIFQKSFMKDRHCFGQGT